ncbi:MAG: hypothetical protein AAFZ80_08835, partial [Cyanobacteria bacterium P01_A01_bin.105]
MAASSKVNGNVEPALLSLANPNASSPAGGICVEDQAIEAPVTSTPSRLQSVTKHLAHPPEGTTSVAGGAVTGAAVTGATAGSTQPEAIALAADWGVDEVNRALEPADGPALGMEAGEGEADDGDSARPTTGLYRKSLTDDAVGAFFK